MTKPTFIFFGGAGWSGTTSLYYTLTKIGYMHGGITKEYPYLERIEGLDTNKWDDIIHRVDANGLHEIPATNHEYDQLLKSDFYRDLEVYKNTPITENPSQQGWIYPNQHPALFKFTSKDIEDLFPSSLDNYLTYYQKLWKYCQETNSPFKAVGDFANTKGTYPKHTLKKIKELLEPHFNVKAIQIFRDPLRRAFSASSSRSSWSNSMEIKNIFEGNNSFIKYSSENDYAEIITTWKEAFGEDNYHYIIMEDFFNPDTPHEVKKLEEFLQISIPPEDIFPCAFVPDKGINAPKILGVRDQWSSDIIKFEPELYMEHRYTTSGKVYKNFKKLHGYLPANWGKPIDYGYND